MKRENLLLVILTTLMAIALIIVSYCGAFIQGVYTYETTSFAIQGMGQDFFNLVIAVPVLLISAALMTRGHKTGLFIFGGTVLYILYSFIIYGFGVHFNQLFLLYCLILGTSLYLFILVIYKSNHLDLQHALGPKIPIKTIGVYFILVASLFYLIWLKDIVPALLAHSVPPDIIENKLIVNPVHIVDISMMLPAFIITGILLMLKHPIGVLMTPFILVFTMLLTMALMAMVIMMNIKGISEEQSIAGIFIALSIISLIFFITFLSNSEIPKES